jgi:hypothetical protein
MTWTRLSDDYTDKPAMLGLSRSARLLDVEGLVWCNRHTTNGALPGAALPRLTDSEDPTADVAELVAAGLWAETETGWQLDWSDQEPADRVRARQERNAEKQKRYRDRKQKHTHGDHSACDPRFCKSVTGNASSNATGNVTGLVTASRPDPSRPVPKGQGTGTEGASDRADARRPTPHQWTDAGSGVGYCAVCGLPPGNDVHQDDAGQVGA